MLYMYERPLLRRKSSASGTYVSYTLQPRDGCCEAKL